MSWGQKPKEKKGLVSYKTNNDISTMKKYVDYRHVDVTNMYFQKNHKGILHQKNFLRSKTPRFGNLSLQVSFCNFLVVHYHSKKVKNPKRPSLMILFCLL
jgi:hypothetical protein